MIVLSLYDLTTVAVQPWAAAGYECYCVDIQHTEPERILYGKGVITKTNHDIMTWLPPRTDYRFVIAQPPCTNQATSGARWFKDKGLAGLADAIKHVERSVDIAEWSDAEWCLENPVSTIASYWRASDYTFQPHEYTGFCKDDNYNKKTCLWTSDGFKMPKPKVDWSLGSPDNRIHEAGPGEGRANFRSAAPRGFWKAVYEANK